LDKITAVFIVSGQSLAAKKGSFKHADSPLGAKDSALWFSFESADPPGIVLVPSTQISALVTQA
jgi:hypothetical protein